jgi:hypothetical protein
MNIVFSQNTNSIVPNKIPVENKKRNLLLMLKDLSFLFFKF